MERSEVVWRCYRFILIILLLCLLVAGVTSADKVCVSQRLESQDEVAAEYATIANIVNDVSPDDIEENIYELQENMDLDPPYTPYRSRYCLRVKETDDLSDDACDNAAEYIFSKFEEYGLGAEYDLFSHSIPGQGHYQMRNVMATLPGKGMDNQKIFVICGHYDSINDSIDPEDAVSTNTLLNWKTVPAPGAIDNASGVAAVLEAARILSRYDFNSAIKFITFSGEELGMLGSMHYAKMAAERGEQITGVLNLDAIGYNPDVPAIDIYTNLGSEWLAEVLLSVQGRYNIGPLILSKVVKPDMVYSDHAPFWQNGYSAIFCTSGSGPFKHTAEDTIDKLSIGLVTTTAQAAIATLASLANPLSAVTDPSTTVEPAGKLCTTWAKIRAEY
jgi:hypothetical protein